MEEVDQIMKAIFNVQQKAGYINKSSEGQVGQRKYKYANLNNTWENVKQLLKDNNLVVYSSPVSSSPGSSVGTFFKMTLYHTESNQSITEYMPMILMKQDPQGIGAAITYYRRYMLQTMLGLIPDDDNDAKEHRLATIEQKKKIVGTVRTIFPDLTTPDQINGLLDNIAGKHPSRILEEEVDNVINLILAYKNE